MIFYFSGTGNSKHVAEKIADHTGERLIYMCEDSIDSKELYEIGENERVGFVFPVYWYSMPTIVEKFLLQLKLSGYQKQYVYAVATFGIAGGHVMDKFVQTLNQKQMQVNGIFGVMMVDNYVVGYNVASPEKQKAILSQAETEIKKIASMVENRENTEYIKKGKIAFVTPFTSYAYHKASHTKKFFATQNCNGCKQCEKNCPCNVIHIVDNKPVWDGDCTFCLKCIHSCKQSAIQYGHFTEKRDRYLYNEQ